MKKQLLALSPDERNDVSAFLWHLKHANDPGHRKLITERLDDKDPNHWLPLDEFIRRLGPDQEE